MCRTPTCGASLPRSMRIRASSRTRMASSVCAPRAGSPRAISHSFQGVMVIRGFRKQRADVQIIRMFAMHLAHGIAIRPIPSAEPGRVGGLVGWETVAQGRDERLFTRARVRCPGVGCLDNRMAPRDGHRGLAGAEEIPGHVVEGAIGIGDTPIRHGAVRIGVQGALKADGRLFVVEAVAPEQTAVEPDLRSRTGRRHSTMMGTQIEGVGRC